MDKNYKLPNIVIKIFSNIESGSDGFGRFPVPGKVF